MVHIQDAVVGDIEPTEAQLKLIDDPHMQKLRYISQLSFTNLVYPGANHSRFEHSLGTLQITKEILHNSLKEADEELECAGLMHDIGHCAFSHYADDLVKKYLNTNHEKIGIEIVRNTSIKDILQGSALSLPKVLDYLEGKGKGSIITGALGSDRLDYLTRDSHYTGVAYGIIDYHSVRSRLTFYKGQPAIYESGVPAAESILMARYSMFSSVYNHHVNRIAKGMYQKAVEMAIESRKMDKEELRIHNDLQMITRLLSIRESNPLIERLVGRRLYKRAYYEAVSPLVNLKEVQEAVEKTGLGYSDYVIETVNLRGGSDDVDVISKRGDYIGKLTEISPIVKMLMSVLDTRKRLIVACDRSNTEKVRRAVERAIK